MCGANTETSASWRMTKVGFPFALAANCAAVCSTLSPQSFFRYKRNLYLLSKIQSLFFVYYAALQFHKCSCNVKTAVPQLYINAYVPFHENTHSGRKVLRVLSRAVAHTVIAAFSPQRPEFSPRSVRVRFVVVKKDTGTHSTPSISVFPCQYNSTSVPPY
jgi:hypothetical protein